MKSNRSKLNLKTVNWKIWNLKIFAFSIEGIPSTLQHCDSHPCTLTFKGYMPLAPYIYLTGYLCRPPLTIAHCCKIADSRPFCKQILDFWCPNLSFGILGAFWRPGILGHLGAQERTLSGPGLAFY